MGAKPQMCGCLNRQTGTYGTVPNGAGGAVTCPNCNGSGSTDPDYVPRPKTYTINPQSGSNAYLAASQAASSQININPNYDFCPIWMTATSTSQTTGGFVGGGFKIELWDSGKIRPWQDAPVYANNICGTAQAPFPVGIAPSRIPANWNIPWTVTETSGSNNTIQVALIGFDMIPVDQQAPVTA